MASFHAVLRAFVDGHHLVLCGIHHGTAVHRNNSRIHRAGRRMRHITLESLGWLRKHAVAHADFFFGVHDVDGGRHNFRPNFAFGIGAVLAALAARQGGLADVLGFIPQHHTSHGIFQRRGIAEQAEGFELLAGFVHQRVAGVAPGIGAVATGQQNPAVLRSHNPRRGVQAGFVNDDGLGQERLNQLVFQGHQGIARQPVHSGAG